MYLDSRSKEDGKTKNMPYLGINQKSLVKGSTTKLKKVARKKDLEKIKIMGDYLVELIIVKMLESNFSSSHK